MGSKFSSKKKTEKQKRTEYSPRTAQEMYNARRTGKLIYPPLSSIPKEEPKRSVRADGRPLYESVNMNPSFDDSHHKYESPRHHTSSHFANYYNQYDDGTFAVLARHPATDANIYRV